MFAPDWNQLPWRKSSRSNGTGECVELADLARHVAVRDSKRPAQTPLTAAPGVWRGFARATRTGCFDLG